MLRSLVDFSWVRVANFFFKLGGVRIRAKRILAREEAVARPIPRRLVSRFSSYIEKKVIAPEE
jgi:hypothetical protein